MKVLLLSLLFVAAPVFAQAPTASPSPGVVNVAITPTAAAMLVGTSLHMQFSEIFSDETTKVVTASGWTSTNTSIASVDNSGLVNGVSPGVVSISAKAGGLTARTTVSVYTEAQLPSSTKK